MTATSLPASQAQTLPLIRHFPPETALAWVGHAVSPQQFIALAGKLAAALPAGRHVINLCEDRYHFLLAFAAALIARRLTLTPASRADQAIAQVQRDFGDSHVVTDQVLAAQLRTLLAGTSLTAALPDLPIPEIAADQAAIVLFTSGSSGQPGAHCKTWGMLVQGADQLQRAFGVTPGSCVLGTVPPQHMFGLESTIVFPLQWGCTMHYGRPLLPADIEQALRTACAPVWLMTTPVHLRACVAEGMVLTGIAGAISATMPLDQASAHAAEQILHCPLHEIYGCTEAGITATRRPAHELEWQLCSDLYLHIEEGEDGQSRLEGARVAQALTLTDRIVMRTPERFSLHGRTGDMVKIAGKRTSLAALNAALLAIDGVLDGSFYRPDSQADSDCNGARLTAFVVAPQLSRRDLIAALRKRIDSVFIPRPLWHVAQLPRDSNGKLPRAALKKLADMLSAPANNIAADPLSGVIAAAHPALDGHFPGNPIVPGILLLSEVVRHAACHYHIAGIKQAKFHAPLRPDQAYAISFYRVSPTSIKFMIQHEQLMIASGLLQCETRP